MAEVDQRKQKRYVIVGALAGMLVAAVIAVAFASESGTLTRYLIMSAGLLVGLFGGLWASSR